MNLEVKVPAVGESITSGTIAQWHKGEGETVARGDVLLTLDTDKISTEIEAEESGVLEIRAQEGDEVAIGSVVAIIKTGEGHSREAIPESQAPSEIPVETRRSEAPAPEAPASKPAASEAKGEEKSQPAPAAAVSPEAEALKNAAAETKGPLTVFAAPDGGRSASLPSPSPDRVPGTADGRTTRRKMTPLRRKIAEQLVSAQQTAAMLTTFNECDMSQVMQLRRALQERFVEKYGVKLGLMSFFIKAAVQALKAVPQVNARVDGDEIVTNHFFDIGVAVGTEKGLIVPVIRNCDRRSFAELEKDIVDYAQRAREGRIQLEDLRGGVFTISNGGIYGSMLSTPILNPPQSGILGMHAIQERPVAVDGKVEIRPMMFLALSYDHRIVDGKEAVTFLIRVKQCIEQPARLLVEI